jgi:hypothetical protein
MVEVEADGNSSQATYSQLTEKSLFLLARIYKAFGGISRSTYRDMTERRRSRISA